MNWRNCGCTTSRRTEPGSGLSAGYWSARAGDAGDDHARRAEDPQSDSTPTAGIRARSLEKGIKLPPVVPAGPNNPLGRYAPRLAYGNGEYLIHGTSAPDSVGLRVSSGCMRMNAADIQALFSQVKTGTPVRAINQPVKFAIEPDGKRYVEVHRPLTQDEAGNTGRFRTRCQRPSISLPEIRP